MKIMKKICAVVLTVMLAFSLCVSVPKQDTNVQAIASAMYISKTKKTIKKGKSYNLNCYIRGYNEDTLFKWSSSNKKIATVTSHGKVKAKKKGKCTIYAKYKYSKTTLKCKITVK